MDIQKEAMAGGAGGLDGAELALINAQSRKELRAEEVYTFCVRLCDNEVDRDGERFSEETLKGLEALFVGKSGVFDHQWSARGQTARIYRTELVREDSVRTAAGDRYCALKGWAYMLRTEANRDLIAEIEGGIKREVSVGCAVERAVCSICGQDMNDRKKCTHVKGRSYGGKLCYAELTGATDAYEWSFVAVPAQKRAGVVKSWKGEKKMELKALVAEHPEYREALEGLEREAEAGQRYLAGLRCEVARLGGLCEPNLDDEVRRGIVDKLGEGELEALKKAYEERLDGLYPGKPQLSYSTGKAEHMEKDGAYLI